MAEGVDANHEMSSFHRRKSSSDVYADECSGAFGIEELPSSSINSMQGSARILQRSSDRDEDGFQVLCMTSELPSLSSRREVTVLSSRELPSVEPSIDAADVGTEHDPLNVQTFDDQNQTDGDRVRRLNQILETAEVLRRNMFVLMEDRDLIDIFGLLSPERGEIPAELTYPIGEFKITQCLICYEISDLNLRPCCSFPACNSCLETYFTTAVSEAVLKIHCPNLSCYKLISRDEIIARLGIEMKIKFNQFLVDANQKPDQKTCPRCSHIVTVDSAQLVDSRAKKYGLHVNCDECHFDWCFPCQAPWHESLKCKEYRCGDRLVKAWAREHHYGQVNAQKCPKCKTYIQRSSGCDHMTCSRCCTHFCYRCGEKFRELKFIGNHYSKLSIFGCKYRFKPDQPVQRKIIRGSIFGGKLLAAPIVGCLALGAGAMVASVGLFILPFYAGYRLHKKIQSQNKMKQWRVSCVQREMIRLNAASSTDPSVDQSYPNVVTTDALIEKISSDVHPYPAEPSHCVLQDVNNKPPLACANFEPRSNDEFDIQSELDSLCPHMERSSSLEACSGSMHGLRLTPVIEEMDAGGAESHISLPNGDEAGYEFHSEKNNARQNHGRETGV